MRLRKLLLRNVRQRIPKKFRQELRHHHPNGRQQPQKQQPPKEANVDKRPEGMADNAQGDYDTLNFIKRQDVFGKPKGGDSGGEDNNADADGAGAAADDDQQQPEEDEEQQPQPEDEDKHDDKEEKQREQAGLQAGMAVGDYETLAELDQDDIFRKK